MSLFGSILSLQDAINRLPQFEYQINKLEVEERDLQPRGSFRNNFIRKCQELLKQIQEHQKRTEKTRTEETYKKEDTLEQIDLLLERLSRLVPAPKASVTSIGSEINNGTSSEDNRRMSKMYEDDSENETTEIIETDVHLDEPIPASPQPKPRQPISITKPEETSTVTVKNELEKEIAKLQNPTKGDTLEVMEPVVVKGNTFTALVDLDPEVEGDLRLRQGRKYMITQTRADGWWTAVDEHGKQGLVPKTFLQHYNEKQHVQSKVSSRLGVRDSVIAISPTAQPRRIGQEIEQKTGGLTRQKDCLGKEMEKDKNGHLSLSCHLAPRLSTSNIGFHDLFWSLEKDQVYKRTVHISKVIRLVRFEKMPLVQNKALVRIALVDVTNPKSPQVVSNVHTMIPRIKGSTWYFEKKENQTKSCVEFSDFILRSNYNSPTVVLLLEASHIIHTNHALEERSLGHTYLRLIIDDKAIPSRTNVLYLDDEIMSRIQMPDASKKRVLLQVMDVPKDTISFVDSLPDVIVFNALYLPFFHFYRRRAGTILIRDNRNPLSAEFISDPLLSIFPIVCDQHDIMDAMLKIWKAKKKLLAKKSEAEQTAEFFQTFLHTAFFLHDTHIVPYDIKDDSSIEFRKKAIEPLLDSLAKGTLKEFVASQRYCPINIFDYSVDLLGLHSID